MARCAYCKKSVPGIRPYDGALACNLCGRILENFNFSDAVIFIKNAAGQSQAAGNIVRSVQSGTSASRERRLRIARGEFMSLKNALGIGDERDDVIDMALKFFEPAVHQNFTKGRRTELVQSSCLYLACREKEIPLLLIDFSSYLRVSVYELGSVYLQLCELLYLVKDRNYEELIDPSIFIQRFTNSVLKGGHDKAENVKKTAKDIIASMKRDWMQTGRKPSGICGAAIYIAALSHGIMCSRTDIGKIVHMCEATITKRLIEFANTEASSLNVDELTERESILTKTSTTRPNSDKGEVICKHKDSTRFGYGLCESCYKDFIKISGGVVGGSDPPAFQRAERERMEKAAREENEGGIEKSEGETYWDAEALDESGNLSDLDGDVEVDGCLLNEEEKLMTKISWELNNREYLEEQAAKALKTASEASKASSANCPLVEASKAAAKQSRKEKQQKRAEEAKNAPPPETTKEAVCIMLERKNIKGIKYDVLEALFDTTSLTQEMEEKSNEREDNEEEMSVIFE